MDTKQLWNEYTEAKYSKNKNQVIAVLEKCAQQKEDALLERSAKRDLGIVYLNGFQGDESVKDAEKAKKYLKESADAGDENAIFFYGLALSYEGDWSAFMYFADAVKKGNLQAAYTMYEYMYKQEDVPIAKMLRDRCEQCLSIVIDECNIDIKYDEDEDGSSHFALALIGLYDLGKNLGIDRAKGEEYLEIANEKGNGNALFMINNSVLMKPETANQYKQPTAKQMKRMEKILAKGHIAEQEELNESVLQEEMTAPRAGMSRFTKILIAIAVLGVVAFIFRKALAEILAGILGPLVPILAIAFLIFFFYMVDSADGFSSSSSSSGSDYDPMKEYKANHDCRNMPNLIYDSSSDMWEKISDGENFATYVNSEKGEVSIHYCDISSKYATGTGGSFHWY